MIDAGTEFPAKPIRLKKVPNKFRHLFFHLKIPILVKD